MPARVRCSARAQGADEVPLAHLRATANVPFLREVVELLSRPVLEGVTGTASTTPRHRRLLSEVSPRRFGQMGDRALPRSGRLRLGYVALGGPHLLPGGHESSPPWDRFRRVPTRSGAFYTSQVRKIGNPLARIPTARRSLKTAASQPCGR